jgi:hypothetical protein
MSVRPAGRAAVLALAFFAPRSRPVLLAISGERTPARRWQAIRKLRASVARVRAARGSCSFRIARRLRHR